MSMHNGANLSLPYTAVLRIAKQTCMFCSIKPPEDSEIYAEYYSDIPIPILLDNGKVRVWIDRYYIARQIGLGEVEYVYVTKTHICEERASRIKLPPEIKSFFGRVFSLMNTQKTKTWVMDYSMEDKIGA